MLKNKRNIILLVVIIVILIFSCIIYNCTSASKSSPKTINSYKNLSSDYSHTKDTRKLLETAKNIHQNGNYDEAINIYNYILQCNNVPDDIKNQTIVFKNVALTKNKIISKYIYKNSYKPYVKKGVDYYKNIHINLDNLISYEALGDYLRFSKSENYGDSNKFRFDSNGIIMVKYGSGFHYNTVTISQYALWLHSKYLNGDSTVVDNFIKYADFLCNLMKSDGSFRYEFDYYSYEQFKTGWTSSMAQGQVLSVLSRAYSIMQNTKYIETGNRAFSYLITPVKNGGVMDTLGYLDPAFKNNIFFQEYVNTISSYTLNGYMFTLLGIYDWLDLSKTVSSIDGDKVNYYFNEGIKSLKIVLPYYDYGGFSSYDLYYLTANTNPTPSGDYHKIHLDLLEAFYSMTKDEFFIEILDQWAKYVS